MSVFNDALFADASILKLKSFSKYFLILYIEYLAFVDLDNEIFPKGTFQKRIA